MEEGELDDIMVAMNLYFTLKAVHIISSTILFGTGIGIAFFMFRSLFTNNLQEKYYAVSNTVLADTVFTLPAVVLQPLSGIALVLLIGYDWTDFWLVATYLIYILAGLCWLPVVFIQIRLKQILATAIETNSELPRRYHQLFRIWFFLGWPAFMGLIVVFYLMVAKPI